MGEDDFETFAIPDLAPIPEKEVGEPITWAVIIFPSFPLLAYSAIVEPLRAANGVAGRRLYDWITLTVEPGTTRSSSGLTVQGTNLFDVKQTVNRVVIVAGLASQNFTSNAVSAFIRRQIRSGAEVGAVSDGPFFLANAGLLDGYNCTVHWDVQSAFREAFPHVRCSRDLFVVDRDRFTAAGGIGALDMMLSMIERDFGQDVALGVSEWFVHSRLRQTSDREQLSVRLRTGASDPRVLAAIAIMEKNIEEPLSAEALAEEVRVSVDTLERLFRRDVAQTAMSYYRAIRFQHARDLLEGTTLRISEIAIACGFSDSSSFARAYRANFGFSPKEYRSQHIQK
ncbi:MAG: GlxA family transcriptional regulator [Alphaproteobacteria bacterium]